MPSITPSYNNAIDAQDRSVLNPTWILTTANADGLPMSAPSFLDMTWQATGTFGGATASLEGSNDGANWFPLTKLFTTTAATFTAAGGCATNENPLFVRPNLSAVGAGATITVSLVAIRPTPVRT